MAMTSRRLIVPILVAILALGFAAVLASGANAATKTRHVKQIAPSGGAASSCRGGNLFPCGPVYNGPDYLGSDPDPFIRMMIQRDLGAKYGGEG
jgi:hypothetical protein